MTMENREAWLPEVERGAAFVGLLPGLVEHADLVRVSVEIALQELLQ